MRSAFAGFSAIIAAAIALISAAGASDWSGTLLPVAAPMQLPGALAEISGLARASDASLYAHNDEQAVIYEIDSRTGMALGSFSIGRPTLTGDFEAVLARDGAVFLIASDGRIVEAPLTPQGRSRDFKLVDTGLGAACEIEGAAFADGGILLACKRSKRRLVIYKWSPADGVSKIIDRKLAGLVPDPGDFRAADLVVDDEAGTLLILDSAAGAILELTMQGEPAGYWRLGGDHPQSEGLALLADGRLAVADEGTKARGSIGGGVLTIYPPRR